MSILVVGSIAIDSVETPFGKEEYALGGSALFFANAASFFSPVNIVGVVGNDFRFSDIEYLKQKGCDLEGITVEKGQTFRWGGRYHKDVNIRDTLYTDLNVFENFRPSIPDSYRESELIFLANIDPELQLEVLSQVTKPGLIVLDTMNFWIHGKRDALLEVVRKVDVMILNDEELTDLTGKVNLYDGGEVLLDMGLKALVVKKGQHGAVMLDSEGRFLSPAYPVRTAVDPTGAGDTFAGGFLGHLSTCKVLNDLSYRHSVIYGTVSASFVVEDFSFNRLKTIQRSDLDNRFQELRTMTQF